MKHWCFSYLSQISSVYNLFFVLLKSFLSILNKKGVCLNSTVQLFNITVITAFKIDTWGVGKNIIEIDALRMLSFHYPTSE